jgi:hypothetical protein
LDVFGFRKRGLADSAAGLEMKKGYLGAASDFKN